MHRPGGLRVCAVLHLWYQTQYAYMDTVPPFLCRPIQTVAVQLLMRRV